MVDCDLIIRTEDETVVAGHITCDTEFSLYIVFHVVTVSVKVIWGDVGDNGDICLEIINIVKLEAAQLENIDVELLGSHLICVALADVSAKTYVHSSLLEKVIDQ